MKKFMVFPFSNQIKRGIPLRGNSLGFMLIGFLLSGCLVRTYSVVKDRVDQDVAGNQGFIGGSAPADFKPAPRKFTQRRTKVVEVELDQPLSMQEQTLSQQKTEADSMPAESVVSPGQRESLNSEEKVRENITSAALNSGAQPVQPADTYVVLKNDTLQKISARPEIYGTTKKWTRIYEANKDKLKAPDKIRPGQTLKIPRD